MLAHRSSIAPGAQRRPAASTSSRSRAVLRVQAIQSKGKTPEQPEATPDPFDRHSSARDKAPPSEPRPNYQNASSMFAAKNRRRGRPAHLRSPDDSPLRDGNRDRLVGLLTERAAKTLLVYLQETNPTVYHWLFCWLKENPIPQTGNWDEISGEVFLRKMLSTPAETAKIEMGRDELFDNIASIGVDPRQMAQRIMEIRVQLSKEFMQDLQLISDENSVLLRETLQVSLANTLIKEPIKELPPRDLSNVFVHPELLSQDGTLHPEVAYSHPELLPVVEQQADRLRATPDTARGGSPGSATPSIQMPPPTAASGMQQAPPTAATRGGSMGVPSPAASRGTGGALGLGHPASSPPLPPTQQPSSLGSTSPGTAHAVNMQPPTQRVTGPWKFSGLNKPTLATNSTASTAPTAGDNVASSAPEGPKAREAGDTASSRGPADQGTAPKAVGPQDMPGGATPAA